MTRTARVRTFELSLPALILLLSVAAYSTPTDAQQPVGAGTSQIVSDQPPAVQKPLDPATKSALDQFSWLVGHWQGQWGPRIAQQVWMPSHAGVMVGTFQLSDNNKTLVIELFTIASTPHGIELRVRHFTPALTPWERSGPSRLYLQSSDPASIVFESADSGRPTRWLMKRADEDTFVARFEIVTEKGDQQVAEIVYHRERATVPARR
jgi:hypothetical protein